MTSINGAPIFKGKGQGARRFSAELANSWDQTLTAAASLTGSAEEVAIYNIAAVAISTDQPGTLFMEESTDGTNWDSSKDYAIQANTNFQKSHFLTRRFYRTRFVSSASSDHTFLRLQTSYSQFSLDPDEPCNANEILFDPDSSQPLYIGLNSLLNASISSDDWLIIKHTYSGNAVTKTQKAIGAWGDRASLFS